MESELIDVKTHAEISLASGRDNPIGLTCGMDKFDKTTKGNKKGELNIIAGRPSMGKTSFMLEQAMGMAKKGSLVLIVSLEMHEDELIQRMICNLSNLTLDQILQPSSCLSYQELISLDIGMESLSQMNIKIKSGSGLKPQHINALARKEQEENGLDCIFIDYVQLMQSDSYKENRQQEITSVVSGLKAIAMTLQIPVIVLSQLNRGLEGRDNKRPRLSDLRESGSIEQDAHKVMLLHRADYHRLRDDPTAMPDGAATIIVAKNRQGPCCDIDFVWIPEYFKFEEEIDPILQGCYKGTGE